MTAPVHRLHVDWLACGGHGVCAELLPELLDLDDWGYPVVTGEVEPHLLPHARAAVNACPALALRVRPRAG